MHLRVARSATLRLAAREKSPQTTFECLMEETVSQTTLDYKTPATTEKQFLACMSLKSTK
jgi:hypothetical protein